MLHIQSCTYHVPMGAISVILNDVELKYYELTLVLSERKHSNTSATLVQLS